jgi:hypothetical protein
MALALLVAVVAAALIVAMLARSWWGRRQQVYRCRCPRCGQKLRFGALPRGRTVTCPRCLRRCDLAQLQPDASARKPAGQAARLLPPSRYSR